MAAALPVDYQQLFRALPESFLLMAPDADATIVDNTDSHVAVSLKSRADVVGKPLFEAFPATNQESAQIMLDSHEYVRQHLAPHTMPLLRYDLVGADGRLEELYWQATHYPILDAQGQLQYILQRTQDVTEQHRTAQLAAEAERALAESQERMRFVLESVPMLIWTATPEGLRDYFNSRWLQFTGRALANHIGNQWLASVHPDDQQRVVEAWRECVKTGQPYQMEYRLRRADGQYRWLLVRALPRHDEAGRITMWVGGGTDIHGQKLLVQELLDTNEQQALLSDQAYQAYQLATQQREMFFALFTQTPALIAILRGPKHRYEFVNPPYQALFPGRELVGRTVAEALPEIVTQGIIKQLDGVYSTGQPFVGTEYGVQVLIEEKFQQRYYNFTYQLFHEGGEKAGVTIFAFDVTDLVLARQALENPRPDAQ